MNESLPSLPLWVRALLGALAGSLITLSLAPFDLWPLGLLSLALLAALLHNQPPRSTWLLALAYGVGLYGAGVSWIYVSIHTYGGASPLLAGLLTGLFVLFMAVMFSLPYCLYGRLQLNRGSAGLLLGFPAIWVLGEWFRAWFLTGFPWLYPGYGHLNTWLAGWAPLVGVIGLGGLLALSAAALVYALQKRRLRALAPAGAVLSLWLAGALLSGISWTRLDTAPIRVAMVQPNIPQEVKWDPGHALPTLQLLEQMSEPLWQHDWVIWPEAAVPLTYHRALYFLDRINQRATDTHTGLITGIIYDELGSGRYFNSVAGLGDALGIYHKRRLVPFGEYVPLEQWLRGLIHFFDLPTSIISIGPEHQAGLDIGGIGISPSVCYEVVYPDLVARSARNAGVLLTISNDAWFADSIGPLQHLQMAQMRALETGRYMIRSTNNGVSALIDPRGHILQRSEQFVQQTLEGTVRAAQGQTPFMRWGSYLALSLALLALAGAALAARRAENPPESQA